MKLSTSVLQSNPSNQFKKNGLQPPPIPYERQERSKDKDREDVSTFKLRTNPTDKDSQIYDMKVLTFKSGTVEEYILWKKDLKKVLMGQNVTSGPNKFAMTRRVLDGDALAAFDKAAEEEAVETVVSFGKCLEKLAEHVFPKNALVAQRQWFHRYLHKKVSETMREFVTRINEMNAMMVEFPPKFDRTQQISADEMKDLLEFAIPISWRVEMIKQAFRLIEHDISKIVEFCERLEFTEKVNTSVKGENNNNQSQSTNKGRDAEQGRNGQKNKGTLPYANAKTSNRTAKHKRQGIVSYKSSGGTSGCSLHQNATDHETIECRVIAKQIDNMRAQYEAQPHPFKRQKTTNNTTKNGTNNKNGRGGDLHTMLDEINSVKARIEKELKQQTIACGKRKSVKCEDDIDTDVEGDDSPKSQENTKNNFQAELEQLSLSDVSEGELEELDLSDVEDDDA